eukprot:CAMPEP_0174946038 /NCGR_PEP_ID=MMETSP1355-20121228/83110_1 /TAXON_ID=464990 /ORGANISM="Hemiselmis tepida, Strain CCMP443" /LENGTH=89 /DNA_ID=CAMNT_0016193443 /DNA_START=94 /DNA_END=360 /DNA_ORIENTATION=+
MPRGLPAARTVFAPLLLLSLVTGGGHGQELEGAIWDSLWNAGASSEGLADGTPTEARFRHPLDIAPVSNDTAAVVDWGNAALRLVNTTS